MNFREPDLANASWAVALRREPEEQFLTRIAPAYLMARQIESHVPEGQTVFALTGGEVAQAYTTRFVMDSFHSASAEKAEDLFFGNADSPKTGARRYSVVFPETKVQQLKIVQNATNPEDMWSINEIRLWRGQGRLIPSAAWRVDAFPNPWDIGLAFDGLEATRWRSWEPMRKSMSISVSFSPAQELDRIDVGGIDGQWSSDMDARILTQDGQWLRPLSKTWQIDQPADLRRAATQVLKGQGIHDVVIGRMGWRSELFMKDPAAWGLHEVIETPNAKLYKID